jgi:hypothetical protein
MTYELEEIAQIIEEYGQQMYENGYEDGEWHGDSEDDPFDVWSANGYGEEAVMLSKGMVRRVVSYNGQDVVNWIQGWNYDR